MESRKMLRLVAATLDLPRLFSCHPARLVPALRPVPATVVVQRRR